MMKKSLLAATVASGLILPTAEAGLYVPPKPAIIKPENIEFSKHLLAMPLTMGMLPGKAASAVTVLNRGVLATNTSALTTYNFTSYSVGTATSTRRIVVVSHAANGTTGSRRYSSMTINGVSATTHISQFHDTGGGGVEICTIASAVVTSGTSITIAVTFNGGMNRAAVYAVSLDGVQSGTAVGTSGTSGTGSHEKTINITSGGFAIGGAGSNTSGIDIGWTGLTERNESAVGSSQYGSADELTNSTGTLTITPTIPSGTRRVSALASFR